MSEEYYEMEAILDEAVHQGETYLLVKWKDYPISSSTWEKCQKVAEVSGLYLNYLRSLKSDVPKVTVPQVCQSGSQEENKVLQQIHNNIRQIIRRQDKINKRIQKLKMTSSNYKSRNQNQEEVHSEYKLSESRSSIGEKEERGSFEAGDIPLKIGQAKQLRHSGKIMYLVMWQKRASGVTPKYSYIESDVLKQKDARLVCNYLKTKAQS